MRKLLPKENKFRTFKTFGTFVFLLTIFTTPVFAQQSVSMTAIPPRLEVSGLPGATLQETLKIRNESDIEMVLEADFSDFIVNNNQGVPMAVTEAVSGRWSLASWLILSPKKIILQPRETQIVNLMIQIPPNGLAGGHYAMVTYQPSTEGLMADQKTASAIIQKVGTLVYLNVIGDVTEAAHLKSFTVGQEFANYGPISLFAEIENLGDTHIRPQGQITVTNWLNRPIAELKLEEKNIFPFASRTYDLSVSGKYRLGRYTARLEAMAGDSQIPLHGLIYFWIVPVKEIGMILAALVLITVIILIAKKSKKKPPTPESTLPVTEENPEIN